jgi:DNA primase
VPADDERIVEVDGREVRVSRPDKVYFPAIDATKSDLVS